MEAFQNAYAASRPLTAPRNMAAQGELLSHDISFATLYDRSQEIIAAAKLIVQKFESANEKTYKIDTTALLNNSWGAENESMANLLGIGHRVGLERFEAMLVGSDAPEVEEGDVALIDMLYKSAEKEKNNLMPWGKIARKQEKSARKLIKAIAVDVK